MKRIIATFSILALFLVFSETASAQFTFFNATNCPVRILGGYNYNNNPCVGPSCSTPWIGVPAGGSVTLNGDPTVCPSPSFPPPPANFFGFKLLVSSTSGTSVDICNSPISAIFDCNGVARTVQIFNYHNGAIF